MLTVACVNYFAAFGLLGGWSLRSVIRGVCAGAIRVMGFTPHVGVIAGRRAALGGNPCLIASWVQDSGGGVPDLEP